MKPALGLFGSPRVTSCIQFTKFYFKGQEGELRIIGRAMTTTTINYLLYMQMHKRLILTIVYERL